MQDIGRLLFAGITSGSIYGIIALAFTLIYNSTKIVNFAQGSFIMSGAMFAYYFITYQKLPIIIALPLIIVCSGIIGLCLKVFIIDTLQKHKSEMFNMVIATLAVGITLEQIFAVAIGKTKYDVPSLVPGDPVKIFFTDISVWPESIVLIVVTSLCIFGFWFFLRTDLGRVIQAIGYNLEAAKITGLKTSKLISITFILSATISAVGGVIIAPIMGASPYMGTSLGVKGFAAAILGGMGNPFAGFVGGLILGIAETFSSFYISSTYSPAVAYLLLLLMLVVKPTGLWPEKEGD